ncbi:MAG: RyR domain-containing protein [Pseudomonadota bacterium]
MNLKFDSDWHDKQIELYTKEQKNYETYADVLEEILQRACRAYAPAAMVQVRSKTISSFAEKAVRKFQKYDDPVHQFTDLCGARVITQTQMEVDLISRFIRDSFVIDAANSVDRRQTIGVSEFGYLSVHFIVQLPKPEQGGIMGVLPPAELTAGGYKAEIQVRTMLQHVWASISHDSLYKNMFKPPAQWHREMNRLAAMLEEADRNFALFVSRLEAYATNHGAYLPAGKRQSEIDTLKTILARETENERKLGHALRIAAICRAVEDWAGIVDELTPFAAQDDGRLARELGHALCRASKNFPNGPEYQKGLDYLEKAVQKDPGDAETHSRLAWALRQGGQAEHVQRIHEHLARAYELKPSDPYYLNAYLESEILSQGALSHISLLSPVILQAIAACRAHAEAQIEIPCAYFTMGRFYLFLDRPRESLLAYLDGLRLCLCEQGAAHDDLIQEEIDFLYHLERFKHLLSSYEAVLRLLIIACFVKAGRGDSGWPRSCGPSSSGEAASPADDAVWRRLKKARERLMRLTTPGVDYHGSVVILAGSCAEAEEKHVDRYKEMLIEAFSNFKGIIVSGGTSNGVGRLAGDLVEHGAGQMKEAVGYLPRGMPRQARPDARYGRHIRTQGEDFSPLEPLQMWIDLLGSGVDPGRVKLVGLGGGAISAIEYRLAILLGAQVGLIEGGGREADALLSDAEWASTGGLLGLVNDRMTVRAFITNPEPMIPPDRIEDMAMKAHEAYRKKKLAEPRPDHNMQPWEKLVPDFQNSSKRQVEFSVELLRQAGFDIEPAASGEAFVDPGFTKEEIEYMAEMEHGRWNVERLRAGWRLGAEPDAPAKISPYLRPWIELDNAIKDYDRAAALNFPKLLWETGLKISRRT